jgi:predicted CopG family antitoxin
MPATTIKLEHEWVEKVSKLKSKDESVSAYVRSLIEHEYRERQNRIAAQKYQQFLADNPEELAAMEDWESAPLGRDPVAKAPTG